MRTVKDIIADIETINMDVSNINDAMESYTMIYNLAQELMKHAVFDKYKTMLCIKLDMLRINLTVFTLQEHGYKRVDGIYVKG